MAKEIFISYSREDTELVEAIEAALEAYGLTWFRDLDIDPGDRWPEELSYHLDNCRVVLALWSPASVRSRFVMRECRYAIDAGKTVIPAEIRTLSSADRSLLNSLEGLDYIQYGKLSDFGFSDEPSLRTPLRQNREWLHCMEVVARELDNDRVMDLVRYDEKNLQSGTPRIRESFRDSHRLRDAPEMLKVRVGKFWAGCEDANQKPVGCLLARHLVRIRRPFGLGVHPVTVAEWNSALDRGFTPESSSRRPQAMGRHPVVDISWTDAIAYCRWLTEKTGRRYRLPSEAEWEYCCVPDIQPEVMVKAGTLTCGRYGETGGTTTEVNQHPPNRLGFRDMLGNVFEWVQDAYDEHVFQLPYDGQPVVRPTNTRVIKGGAWTTNCSKIQPCLRGYDDTASRSSFIGFRVAADIDE